MIMKQCSICHRKVHYLVMHMQEPQDRVLVSMLGRNLPDQAGEYGICLPCLDRFKQSNISGCFDIRVTCN